MLKQAWQNWIKTRFKFDRHKALKQKDILVFIYQQGYLYLVLILITFIAGVNYGNNLILGFCFLISAILCISFYLTFKQLHELEIEIVTTEVGQVGEVLQLQLHFKQELAQARYLWIKADHQLEQVLIQDSQQQYILTFFAAQRGQFHYPQLHIYSVYPFGLVRAWTYLNLSRTTWVAPKADIYSAENKQHLHSFQPDLDEFRELRDFQLGDSLQAVSWKQAARGQGLYVKVFEQYQDQQSIDIHYEHMPAPTHEEKLSLMMGLVEQCEQQQLNYAMFLPHATLEKGLGERQLKQAKILLAQA